MAEELEGMEEFFDLGGDTTEETAEETTEDTKEETTEEAEETTEESTEEAEETTEESTEESTEETKEAEPPAPLDYKEVFGEAYSDPEVIKERLKKAEELEQQISSFTPTEFANDHLKRMNNILLETPEMDVTAAYRLSSLTAEKLQQMDDKAVLRLKEQLDSPEIAEDDRLLGKLLASRYTLMPSDEALEDMTDAEIEDIKDKVRIDQIRMKKDANATRKELLSVLDKVDTKPGGISPEDITKQKQELLEVWKKAAPKVIPKELPVPLGQWDKELMKYGIDKSEFDKIVESIPEYAAKAGLTLNEENFKQLGDHVVKEYYIRNLPKIMKAAHDKIEASVKLQLEKKYSKPSAAQTEQKAEPDAHEEGDFLSEMGF